MPRPPKPPRKAELPSWALEAELQTQGFRLIAGLDEVGRGCLAGPVVAAAVILPSEGIPLGINDSKKLTALKREALSEAIREIALSWSVGVGSVEEIDSINILQASRLAMVRALEGLDLAPEALLIDGRDRIASPLPQKTVIGGDGKSLSIAAASILAKVYRDQMMKDWDRHFPGYGFAGNKGYGSEDHRRALQDLGPTPLHRRSFSWTPV